MYKDALNIILASFGVFLLFFVVLLLLSKFRSKSAGENAEENTPEAIDDNDKLGKIERLVHLRNNGDISDAEFTALKQELINK